MTTDDRFVDAAAVADATLFEGYVLYPYRASSNKNRCRWQFGVLAPPAYAETDPSERSHVSVGSVASVGPDSTLHARVRLLHVQQRTPEVVDDDGVARAVREVETADGTIVAWDEAVEVSVDLAPIVTAGPGPFRQEAPIDLAASTQSEAVADGSGRVRGHLVRSRARVTGTVAVDGVWLDRPRGLIGLTMTVTNTTTGTGPWPDRDAMTRQALVAVHCLMAVDEGRFLSSMEPPDEARDLIAACPTDGLFPVLVGKRDDVVLASPIILYDHPAVAPESPGDLYDATEIDEILALRVLTLTPAEKAQARALDPRAAAIVDRCDSLEPETWSSLHGTAHVAEAAPSGDAGPPEEPGGGTVVVDGIAITSGSKVELRPSHRADAQDLFLVGRRATVAGVFRDVNEVDQLVAVTVDDDPATELLLWHGRYLYFHPDEIRPLDPDEIGQRA